MAKPEKLFRQTSIEKPAKGWKIKAQEGIFQPSGKAKVQRDFSSISSSKGL